MHIDELLCERFAEQREEQLVYFYIKNTTSVDQQEAKTLPQIPQPNRVRVGSEASALQTTLDNLAWTGIVEQ